MNLIGLVEYKKRVFEIFNWWIFGLNLFIKKKKKKRIDVYGNCYYVIEIIKNINVFLNKVVVIILYIEIFWGLENIWYNNYILFLYKFVIM